MSHTTDEAAEITVPLADILAGAQARIPALIADLLAWTGLESPSSDAEATTRMAGVVAAHMAARGARVELVAGRAHGALVRAVWGADAPGPPVLLLGHHDTVHPHGSLARNPPRVAGDRVYGPGGYDMKAGLLLAGAALEALQATGAALRRPVLLISTADEEVNSVDSRPLIEALAPNVAAALVLEPAAGDGALKTARKGIGGFTVTARGRAAHAGVDHAAGVSAITELAHQALALAALTDYERGVTVNVGRIQGGTTWNTVPAEAVAHVDVRAPTAADGARISAAIRALRPRQPGARLEVTGGMDRPPMERGPAGARLFALAQALGRQIGLDLRETATGGASDGNLTAAGGAPTLDGLGACGAGAHTDEEYVRIPDLAPRAAVLAGLIAQI
jgi:glutamate carboxypeptidase